MLDLFEGFKNLAPDTLGGGVRRDQLGVLLLEIAQFRKESVVGLVLDLRGI